TTKLTLSNNTWLLNSTFKFCTEIINAKIQNFDATKPISSHLNSLKEAAVGFKSLSLQYD
ncbi:MAG: hypothetical protein SO029_06485, partial [Sodaliphilus sp.]|nr:hypothetical protein [Sodaliphilus sp.]